MIQKNIDLLTNINLINRYFLFYVISHLNSECLITVFTIFIMFFFAGLLIAANPYFAIKGYPDN